MIRDIYRGLGFLVTLKAASRGPGALARHLVRRQAHKHFSIALRKALKP